MSSEPCLRIKKGLIWQIKNQKPFTVISSPEFALLNSIWMAEIDSISDYEKETSDLFLNIILRNLCELQPPQPFEVVTFLENERNNVHMMCSKVAVSSGDTSLYKVSISALTKKLPDFRMINDLTVLFLFSASTDLGLNVKTNYFIDELGILNRNKDDRTSNSRLHIAQCLLWESKMPRKQSQESPTFSLLDSKFKLEIVLAKSEETNHSAYQISLNSIDTIPPFPTLGVKTFLDHKDYDVQYRRSLRPDGVVGSCNTVYKERFDSILADAEKFQHCNNVIVASMFHPSTKLALVEELEEDKSVLLDCSLCRNSGCFIRSIPYEPYPLNSTDRSEKLSAEFQGLSQCLSQLLSNGLLYDVQLKCENTLIPAHKAILAARSKLFKSKIAEVNNNLDENKTIEVDVELSLFRLLLKYLYSGEMSDILSQHTICRLYVLSSSYEVESLHKMCRCFLARNLREDNYIDVMHFASSHLDKELQQAIYKFVSKYPQIMQSAEWKDVIQKYTAVSEDINSVFSQNELSI